LTSIQSTFYISTSVPDSHGSALIWFFLDPDLHKHT
jgi:hypothetical protein